MGEVKDTVQFHVDDGDVQVAKRIWHSRDTDRTGRLKHVKRITPDGVSLRWDEGARRMKVIRIQPKVTGCRNKKMHDGKARSSS